MSDEMNLSVVRKVMETALSFVDIFGALPDGTTKKQRSHLNSKFSELARAVHPDHVDDQYKGEANEIFRMLRELWEGAKTAQEEGVYAKPFDTGVRRTGTNTARKKRDEQMLKSAHATYAYTNTVFRTGDFSSLFTARVVGPNTSVILKVASQPTHNLYLEHEAKILRRFQGITSSDLRAQMKQFIPSLLDTFLVPVAGGKAFRVNVFPHNPDYVSVAQIIDAFPGTLDPRDAAWITRRIFAQVMAAESMGLVHGAIVPDHVLVHPISHDPIHIGWTQTLHDPAVTRTRLTSIIEKYRDWYPPEVFAREIPDNRLDVYMAGKTAMKLFGGDPRINVVPNRIPVSVRDILTHCVQESPHARPQSGREVFDAFDRVIRDEWGKRYRPLHMPIH